jgi:hypothetical protein
MLQGDGMRGCQKHSNNVLFCDESSESVCVKEEYIVEMRKERVRAKRVSTRMGTNTVEVDQLHL